MQLSNADLSKKISRTELILLAAAAILVAGFMANWALKAAIHYQKDVIVPDLKGKPLLEALNLLSAHNLGLKKEGSEFNDTVPAGTILRQQPSSGALVREGKIIRITVSQGGETVFVPDLVGQSLRSAEIALRTNFLSLGEISNRPSIKYGKDVVVSQDPLSKTIASKNSLVHVIVSNGPPEDGTLLMPDFIGKNWEEVETWAKQKEVKIESMKDPQSALPDGVVAQQDAAPDAALTPGQTIRFTISAGGTGAAPTTQMGAKGHTFHFDVPQGESPKDFSFILVDTFGSREIWRGSLEPGSKHDIPLPEKLGSSARIRIFVNGILTEERPLQ